MSSLVLRRNDFDGQVATAALDDAQMATALDELKHNTMSSLVLRLNDFVGQVATAALDDAQMATALDELKHNTTVQSIDILGYDRKLFRTPESGLNGNMSIVALANVLTINTTITSVRIECYKINPYAMKRLAEAISINTTLTSIRLKFHEIGLDMRWLAESLKVNSTLTSIEIRFDRTSMFGMTEMANALHSNSTIQSIHLMAPSIDMTASDLRDYRKDEFPFGTDCALQWAIALQVNATITSVNFALANITDEGIVYLANALKMNTSLVSVGIGACPIRKIGIDALEEALKTNVYVSFFSLKCYPMTSDTMIDRDRVLDAQNMHLIHVLAT